MKKRLLAIMLLFSLVLAGCGSKPKEESDKITSEITPSASGDTSTGEEKYFVTFEAITTDGTAWNSDKFADSKLTMINV